MFDQTRRKFRATCRSPEDIWVQILLLSSASSVLDRNDTDECFNNNAKKHVYVYSIVYSHVQEWNTLISQLYTRRC